MRYAFYATSSTLRTNICVSVWVAECDLCDVPACSAAEPAEADIMNRPPRRPGKRLLGKLILWRCFFVSGLLVILVLGMYGKSARH